MTDPRLSEATAAELAAELIRRLERSDGTWQTTIHSTNGAVRRVEMVRPPVERVRYAPGRLDARRPAA